MNPSQLIATFWWIPVLLLALVAFKYTVRIFGVIIIPQDSIGIVNKRWVLFGKNRTLPDGAIIALKGEAGIQADTLAPGVHFFFWPWQYSISVQKFITIPETNIGVVEARDGKPLTAGRVLGQRVECGSFQDARAFLTNGGERGPQITIIPPGTYRINTQLFTVGLAPQLEIKDNMVGIVTTKEGKPLNTGEIAGHEVQGHNMFQDADTFVKNGGYKGLQEQVILAGRWFVNPLFATVEIKPMTEVEIAHVGVVIAYVGATGVDVTGETFKHGNLVSRGQKGVWNDPLDPGKYPINPFTHRVESVPTANVVLNWANGKTEAHKLDANLSTITVRSSDGFTFNLDVSQIIHIPRNDAPKVIARFGTVSNLVTQVLEPTIGNYFRNAAQKSDVIAFLTERSERQTEAKNAIGKVLVEYNVGAVDTLIGDITPPADLMTTLTDRKLAEQRKTTYGTQREAQDERARLQQATAMADTQASVVTAQRQVEIQGFDAEARVKKATGDAKSKTINADADATVTKVTGEATAARTLAIGSSEAKVMELKVASLQSGNYALIQVAEALSKSGQKLVPEIVIAGGADGKTGGTLVDVLLGNLTLEQIRQHHPAALTPPKPPTTDPAATAMPDAAPQGDAPAEPQA